MASDLTAMTKLDRNIEELTASIATINGMIELYKVSQEIYDIQADTADSTPMRGAVCTWAELKSNQSNKVAFIRAQREAQRSTATTTGAIEHGTQEELFTAHLITIPDGHGGTNPGVAVWIKSDDMPEVDMYGRTAVWSDLDPEGKPRENAGTPIIMHRLQSVTKIEEHGVAHITTQMAEIRRDAAALRSERNAAADYQAVNDPGSSEVVFF